MSKPWAIGGGIFLSMPPRRKHFVLFLAKFAFNAYLVPLNLSRIAIIPHATTSIAKRYRPRALCP